MIDLITKNFPIYLEFLRTLVDLPSVFTRPEDVSTALKFCEKIFRENLSDFEIYFDSSGNLIAKPRKIDPTLGLLYLSSHIDTVDATASEWQSPFLPFKAFEDDVQIVGRGVNDCKAGVAFELLIAALYGQGEIGLANCIFTITRKEEGPGEKTACAIAKAFDHELPLSDATTYLLVLENNVKLSPIPCFYVYPEERSSFTISVAGDPTQLGEILNKLAHWKPVAIVPDENVEILFDKVHKQNAGHVCSIPDEDLILRALIGQASSKSVFSAGDLTQMAVVPTEVKEGMASTPISHTLILSNRGFDTREEVEKQLLGIKYIAIKDFNLSTGFSRREAFVSSRLGMALLKQNSEELNLKVGANIGSSDASIIFNSISSRIKDRIIPIVAGPGSMSQRNVDPPRLTHGVNETFNKSAGYLALLALLRALNLEGFVSK